MRRTILLSLAAALAAAPAPAQDTTLAARIRRVENGLITPVVVAGGADPGAPIAERMRALGMLQAGGSVAADRSSPPSAWTEKAGFPCHTNPEKNMTSCA